MWQQSIDVAAKLAQQHRIKSAAFDTSFAHVPRTTRGHTSRVRVAASRGGAARSTRAGCGSAPGTRAAARPSRDAGAGSTAWTTRGLDGRSGACEPVAEQERVYLTANLLGLPVWRGTAFSGGSKIKGHSQSHSCSKSIVYLYLHMCAQEVT